MVAFAEQVQIKFGQDGSETIGVILLVFAGVRQGDGQAVGEELLDVREDGFVEAGIFDCLHGRFIGAVMDANSFRLRLIGANGNGGGAVDADNVLAEDIKWSAVVAAGDSGDGSGLSSGHAGLQGDGPAGKSGT